MAWWNKKQTVEERSLPRESTMGPIMVAPSVVAGDGVEARQAIGISAVWSCVRVLCDSATLCPLQVYREQADGSRQRVKSGRLVDLIERPAPGMTGVALGTLLVQHLSLFGEAFLGKLRDGGVITGLEALSPERVTVEIVKGEPRYQYYSPRGQIFEGLTVADIIHIKGMSLDGVRGASPVAVCRAAMNLANSLTTAASATWDNDAVPSGILTVPSGPTAQDQANSLAKAWQARHGGPENRSRIAVISGDVGWTSVSMSLQDAQFIEQQRMSLAEVARLFNIPPSRVNVPTNSPMTYSNITQEATQFVQSALGPRLRLIEKFISADSDLCSQAQYCEFDLDGLLRGDPLSRAQVYAIALNPVTGWLNRDEVRAMENLPREAAPPPAQTTPLSVEQVLAMSKNGGAG